MTAMESPRNAVAFALLAWLLLLHSCPAPCVLGADECWILDRHRYYYCFRTSKCRSACLDDHFVDGRCNHGFPYLLPLCECLRPECAAGGTGPAEIGLIPD
ncbi:hypothetical protein ACP70R_039790 [Stipagrostis hirtigluma subsp. patula]